MDESPPFLPDRLPSPELNPLDITTDLVPAAPIKPAGITELNFDGLLATPLKLREDLKNGCGGQLWPAGMVLAKYMLRMKRDLRGESIIELGAGGGLVGLALALGCSVTQPIHITDQPAMLALMTYNITLNSLSPSLILPSIYDWGTTPPPPSLPPHPSIILAADCVYFEPAFPLLLQTLQNLVGEDSVCWFAFKKRRRADLGFVRSARRVFEVREVEDDPEVGVWRREGVFFYKITKKKNKSSPTPEAKE